MVQLAQKQYPSSSCQRGGELFAKVMAKEPSIGRNLTALHICLIVNRQPHMHGSFDYEVLISLTYRARKGLIVDTYLVNE